jgi:hypothetical protein
MARTELLEAALAVARRHHEGHHGYESKEKACRALRRRFRGLPEAECSATFERAFALWVAMVRAVEELIGPNPPGIAGIGPGSVIEAEIGERFPEFPISAIANSIGYLGYHLSR